MESRINHTLQRLSGESLEPGLYDNVKKCIVQTEWI